MKIIIMFSILLLRISLVFAQTKTGELTEAENLFANNKFAATWPYYQDQLKKDSLNADLNFKMGVCYLNSRSQKDKAINCFKKVIGVSNKSAAPIITYKLLADACYLSSNFEQAIVNYEKYRQILLAAKDKDPIALEEVTQKIETCKMGDELKQLKELMASLVNHKFTDTSKNTNSSYPDYSSSLSADKSFLTITFRRSLSNGTGLQDKDFFEDNYATGTSTNAVNSNENSDTALLIKEATIATSVDGQIILTYRDEKGDGNLYASVLNGNEWTTPEKLNEIINTKGWETNEFISADGNTLYFTSDRPGGFGGKDIYKSIKLPTGAWSKAINLGAPVNTLYDDEAPFIHPDGATLYFSSNRQKANRNFDIYTCTLSDSGTWSAATSVGYPINKSTNTGAQKNSKADIFPEKDNFIATFINQKKIPLTLTRGKIIGKDGKIPEYIEIIVTNNETGEITGVYHSNGKSGKYIIILPPGINANITYRAEGYLFHSENVNISGDTNYYKLYKTIELAPLTPGSQEILNNVFFSAEKNSLSTASTTELNNLLNFLIQHPKLAIEVTCSSNKKDAATDNKDAEDKMRSVVNYLVENGLEKERIEYKIYQKTKKSRKKKENEPSEENETGKLGIKLLNIK